jgi:hypothetical protein
MPVLLKLPWMEILAEVWKITRKLWQGMPDEGMYEVLEYESRLELLDKNGKRARFTKRQRVKYLQNHIIAYQDQAWGNGEILLDYRCSPGRLVDRYQPGHKTYLLISLREAKRRGDEDEFNIQWEMREGFRRATELWETEISHRTRRLKVEVVFPEGRPPLRVWLVEVLGRRRTPLGAEARRRLADGRWLLSWEREGPRLNERYQLEWEW